MDSDRVEGGGRGEGIGMGTCEVSCCLLETYRCRDCRRAEGWGEVVAGSFVAEIEGQMIPIGVRLA